MTTAPEAAPARPSFIDSLAVYLKPRVLIVLFLGFSSGLPLARLGPVNPEHAEILEKNRDRLDEFGRAAIRASGPLDFSEPEEAVTSTQS